MAIISINHIVDVNHLVEDAGLPYKVHLSDACGRQSCWVEELAAPASDDEKAASLTRLHDLLSGYFRPRRITLEFAEDGMRFWA
ncbi:MAG: hypothetical protein PHR15_01415 [Atopobiaceae bacterium]|jgi:hypothetical protein|nr:hypothetical protein [Atopobiaceae bacterium]MCH4181169.1 hypothetical protein [Atopobiaceae bacterium]MCH4215165.1 hypothetical protein [Atopobiaceae bacterium]MCH4229855.1 hypothetical protein [Atopobiaceae bacterium]MCH4277018.1 hypothetical protein [Atopobiaceae bacterium]